GPRLRHRSSPQRHFAGPDHRRCRGAVGARGGGRSAYCPVRHGTVPAGAGSRMSAVMTDAANAPCIRVNGADEPLSVPTLSALLALKDIPPERRGIAIALNGAVVPRTAWSTTPLRAGDAVEIVLARQGG